MNPPALWILKRIKNRQTYKYFSLLINYLEIALYTAEIYFVGGIRAAYLSLIYAALTCYVGVVAPKRAPFIIAGLCAITFTCMVLMEFLGFIPHQYAGAVFNYPLPVQIFILLVITGMLFVVEFISYFTSDLLRKARRDLQDKNVELEEKARELIKTQAQLIHSGKLASIGEFASGVAHELNQPLMVLRGTAQLVSRHFGKNRLAPDKLLEELEPIERNTKRMMNIINHLRVFSRQSQPDLKPVDVNQIIEDSFLMVGEQLRLLNIEVKKELDADLPKTKGDANQLEQVFLNLITNARDAILQRSEVRGRRSGVSGKKSKYRGRLEITTRMGQTDNQPFDSGHGCERHDLSRSALSSQPKGSPTSRVERQSTVNNQQSQKFVEILIRDNGGGIPSDKIDKIFDPFFTTKEVGKGTGLGLSISYGIIQDHKGEIEVAETGTEGTTFRIRLPIDIDH